ncbi:MAG: hypothetical protein ACI4R8_03330 [Candidatus Caccovivens sp.]
MFLRKKYREIDNEISKNESHNTHDELEINIKVDTNKEIFSEYDYDNNEKLKPELGEFIYDKAKFVTNQDIKLKIYSQTNLNQKDVESAIKNHYKKEYLESKQMMRKNLVFSFAMLILGLIALTFLLIMHAFFYNEYLYIITEIATWVFIWEAVDSFFLERVSIKRKRITFLKLYSAKIEFIQSTK